MSIKLLEECLAQLERHGLGGAAFQEHFMSGKGKLLRNADVATRLIGVAAQEDEPGAAGLLLGLLLDEARMGRENGDARAEKFLTAAEAAIADGCATERIEPARAINLARLYRHADLPIPQALLIDPDAMAPPPDMETFDIAASLEGIARDVLEAGGSAYDLFDVVDGMIAAVPEPVQGALAGQLASMENPVFERCALYMLLAGSDPVQEAVSAGLRERLKTSALTAETLTLLPIIRGWVADGPTRQQLDDVIKQARRKANAAPDAAAPAAEIQKILATIADGADAQSLAVLLQRGNDIFVAMILMKVGHGIKDAFVVPPGSEPEAEEMMARLREETGADEISAATLRLLLEGALADGLASAHLPAPGFLDVIEACGLLDLRPQTLSFEKLLDFADPERKVQDASAQALGRWINDDRALENLEALTESWFEDSEDSRAALAGGRTARGIETRLWKFLDTRRAIWARRFLQTAVMLRDAEHLREWKTLTASAHGLIAGRPLKRIPLMEAIAHMTIEAATARALFD